MSDPTARDSKGAYWNQFYAKSAGTSRPLPSQFAAFVAGELHGQYRVVEFGCGNGRDALFFASYGHQVCAIDGSTAAVERGAALADALGEKVDFIAAAIDDPGLASLVPEVGGKTLVYGRFFLHAITDTEEQAFLARAAELTKPGDLMAVEYRTIRDSSGVKETDAHYRRFMSPAEFQYSAIRHGFRVTYAVEGYGFAKYKHDDAYVARTILERV
jgi:SAM-dependent methyltransferase